MPELLRASVKSLSQSDGRRLQTIGLTALVVGVARQNVTILITYTAEVTPSFKSRHHLHFFVVTRPVVLYQI